MGFQKTVGGSTVWTLEHFEKVFSVLGDSQSELRMSFKNTFSTFFINLLMYPVSIIVSYFLYKKIKGHNVFRILFYLPTVV
jgi:ABC-type sugar transport system permease subunit